MVGDGYLKWRGVSRLDWAWNGFDVIGTLRYLDGYREQVLSSADLGGTTPGKFHYVKHTWMLDVQGSYELTFVAPVGTQPVAGYSKDAKEVVRGKDGKAVETGQTANYSCRAGRPVLNNTKITVGCNNVFGQDPPDEIGFEFGNANELSRLHLRCHRTVRLRRADKEVLELVRHEIRRGSGSFRCLFCLYIVAVFASEQERAALGRSAERSLRADPDKVWQQWCSRTTARKDSRQYGA